MTAIRLRHKELEGLYFGPDNEIIFGIRGGFPPGETVVDDQHSLYAKLWELEGANLEVVGEGVAKVYVSPIDPALEFPSRAALLASIRREAATGDAIAVAWLARNGDVDDEPDDDDDEESLVRAAFGDPEPSEVDEPPVKKAPPKRRPTRRGKSRAAARGAARHATQVGQTVASPAPIPPAGVVPPGGV